VIVWLGCVLAGAGAEVPARLSPKLQFIPSAPSLAAAAQRHEIPLSGMDVCAATNALRPGDSATVLVTFVQKKKQTQWLLYLEALSRDPAKATNKPSTFVVNSAFGPMKFKSRPCPVKLTMLGPFAAGAPSLKGKATEARFSINEDFLALGLDQSAALLYQWSQKTNFNNRVTSKALLALNPTRDEQRAISATFPALISYFEIVQHTEGLEDLLRKLIDPPSLWSIVKHRGVQMTLTFGDGALPSPANPADWNLEPSAPAYHFPWMLRLNGEPTLKFTLITTRARPPLLLCGGVAGVLAEKIGDDATYMTLRVVSARCAAEKKSEPGNRR